MNPPANPQTNAADVQSPLETFAQNLLIEKGVVDLDAELVAGMKQDILERLEILSTKVMLSSLSEADAAEFERLVDSGSSPAQLQQFASDRIPDLSQRMTDALLRFRSLYLGAGA